MNKKNAHHKIHKEVILNISSETICFIIGKSREFQAKEGVTFPEKIKDSENEYDTFQILADHKDDLTFQEVASVINDLEPDQKIELLALLYLGRGDFEIDEWSKAKKMAKERLVANNLMDYLFSKPFLSDYLENSLNLLGYSCN